jgi:hypothetical protein
VEFAALLRADLLAAAEGRPPPVHTAAAILAAAESLGASGIYDGWAVARLWRLAMRSDASGPALVKLFGELTKQARVADALAVAAGGRPSMSGTAPMEPRGWRSKGGPGRRPPAAPLDVLQETMEKTLAAAKKAWPTVGPGTWRKDALARLEVGKGSPAVFLVRAGRRTRLNPGDTVEFGRLDLLETPPGPAPTVLGNAPFGDVEIPPGSLVPVWRLPSLLREPARVRIEFTLDKALAGDEAAAAKLEKALPLTHAAIREALAKSPEAKGAARLRTIIALFDM